MCRLNQRKHLVSSASFQRKAELRALLFGLWHLSRFPIYDAYVTEETHVSLHHRGARRNLTKKEFRGMKPRGALKQRSVFRSVRKSGKSKRRKPLDISKALEPLDISKALEPLDNSKAGRSCETN